MRPRVNLSMFFSVCSRDESVVGEERAGGEDALFEAVKTVLLRSVDGNAVRRGVIGSDLLTLPVQKY